MIYFDNSATTPMSEGVLKTYQKVSQDYFANPSSLHELGDLSSHLLQQSRQQIADLLKVQAHEVFFTSGGTEADNWAIKGTAFEKEKVGRHIICSSVEHPAVLKTFEQLEAMGFEATYLPVDEEGRVNPLDLESTIRPDTILVSIMAVNNEVGTIQPLGEIAEILRQHPSIHFHVDAVQALGKIDLDLSASSRVDLATFSSHKFHGPRGVGFLYIKEGRKIMPLLNGGGQEHGQRSGTENTPAIAAMAKAVRQTLENQEEKRVIQASLILKLRQALDELDLVHVFTPNKAAPHILCFGIEGIRGEVLVHALEEKDIYVSTTSACSSRKKSESSTLQAMKVESHLAESAIRVSLSEVNTQEEMETFIHEFKAVYDHFSGILSHKGE